MFFYRFSSQIFITILLIVAPLSMKAGVTLKELSAKQYKRLVTPHLREIVQAYQKLFIKINPDLKKTISYTPYSAHLLSSLSELRQQCQKEQLKPICRNKVSEFKKTITPIYNFWKSQITADTTSSAIKISTDLKLFINMNSSPPIGEKMVFVPSGSRLLSLYTLPYPFLLSKIDNRVDDMNKLWGNGVSIIINDLLFKTNLKLLRTYIDQINLQINETRMIWTRRQKVAWSLQKSINYIHSQWNFMLKSTLKF